MNPIAEDFLTNPFGEEYLYSVNREDFAAKSAADVFASSLDTRFFERHQLHVVIGTDSGLLPAYVEHKGIPMGARYLFIEAEECIASIRDILELKSQRILLCSPDDPFGELNKQSDLGEVFYFYLGHVLLHNSVAASRGHLDRYQELHRQFEEEIHARTFFHQGRGNQNKHLTNRLLNAPEAYQCAPLIRNLFPGKTAVVFAAGHSMTQHMDWIKDHRADLVLVAISRVCATLLKHEVEPDVIVSVDPQAINYRQSLSMLRCKNSVFAHPAYCDHSLTSIWPGKKVVIGERLPWESKLNEDYIDSYDVTVSNAAITTAFWLGCQQILLMGVDLCHTKSGQVYAESSANLARSINPRLFKATTNGGSVVFTTQDYLESARGIAFQGALFRMRGALLINPNADSMQIDHVEHLPIEQIPISPLPCTARETLEQALANKDKPAYWSTLEKELRQTERRLNGLLKQVKLGKTLLNQIKQAKHNNKNPFEKLRNITNRLGTDDLADYVKQLHWTDFAEISLLLESEDKASAIASQERYLNLYDKSIHATIKLLNLPLQKIKLLREEAQANANEGVNVLDWGRYLASLPLAASYGYDGICYKWMHEYPEKFTALSDDWQQAVERCAQLIVDQANRTPPAAPVSWTKQQLQEVFDSTILLTHKFYRQHDREALDALADLLQNYPKDAEPYRLLCIGMSFELDGQLQEAIDAYQKILEIEAAPTLKEALQQIAQICVEQKDLENVLFAIDALAQIDSKYFKVQAEALTSLFEYEAAIDSYAKYLEYHPSDVSILPNLAKVMLELGYAEQLHTLCSEMLARNPNSAQLVEYRDLAQQAMSGGATAPID
ncbi:MAG: DUF115 domain-containing protein [Gammaproteobacteria bacterium]|nr:DUF115 domain-containing protein [Gammaproteobacteria bacterium]